MIHNCLFIYKYTNTTANYHDEEHDDDDDDDDVDDDVEDDDVDDDEHGGNPSTNG